jgi:sarcosine oxidase
MSQPDVLIVGLGAMGAAAALRARRSGLAVLGLDRHRPPHPWGSTHGESRITRQAIGEGLQFVPLALRSHELWRELESESGQRLMTQCGGLWIHGAGAAARLHDQDDFFGSTLDAARRFAIAHELLDATAMRSRFPRFLLRGDERGYFEPGAGWLDPEACVAAQLRLAAREGAILHHDEPVVRIAVNARTIVVETAQRRIEPGALIVSAGAWIPRLLPAWARGRLVVRRQLMHWFEAVRPPSLGAGQEPVFIWHWGIAQDDVFYGFPAMDGAMKMATEQRAAATDPDAVERTVATAESAQFFTRHVQGRIAAVRPQVVRAASCLYTNAPGANFIIDTIEDHPRAIAVSACSGHGFKHSAAIGEALARWLAQGRRPSVLAPFARDAARA